MKIAITGGAGYIGAELVAALSTDERITELVVYDDLSRGHHGLFMGPRMGRVPVRFVQGDILDSRKLRKELAGMDRVFHLAAKVTTPFADAGHHHFEQEVAVARHQMAGDHLRHGLHCRDEAVGIVAGMPLDPDERKRRDRQPDRGAVHQRPVARQHPGLLQQLDPPRARRRRQPDLLGQHDVGNPGVRLQLGEDLQIDRIQSGFGRIAHMLRSNVAKIANL